MEVGTGKGGLRARRREVVAEGGKGGNRRD